MHAQTITIPKLGPIRRVKQDLPFVARVLTLTAVTYVLGGAAGIVVADQHPRMIWQTALLTRLVLLLAGVVVASFRSKSPKWRRVRRHGSIAVFFAVPAGLVFKAMTDPSFPLPNPAGFAQGVCLAVVLTMVYGLVKHEIVAAPKAMS